jgi:hypothetical protein
MNKSIATNRIFNKKIPFIYSITPTIYEDGKKEIVVVFANSKNCKGIAVVSENKEVTFEFMRDGFSINETIKFLKDNFDYFNSYFTALNSFAVEYPGFGYEWNSDAQNLYSKELLNDGFVAVRFDLNDPQNTRAFLSRIEDIDIARTRTRKYGEMYDFVEFYNDAFLRSFKVNEDELNPLYKKIVENSKVNSKGQERVLKK